MASAVEVFVEVGIPFPQRDVRLIKEQKTD